MAEKSERSAGPGREGRCAVAAPCQDASSKRLRLTGPSPSVGGRYRSLDAESNYPSAALTLIKTQLNAAAGSSCAAIKWSVHVGGEEREEGWEWGRWGGNDFLGALE